MLSFNIDIFFPAGASPTNQLTSPLANQNQPLGGKFRAAIRFDVNLLGLFPPKLERLF